MEDLFIMILRLIRVAMILDRVKIVYMILLIRLIIGSVLNATIISKIRVTIELLYNVLYPIYIASHDKTPLSLLVL